VIAPAAQKKKIAVVGGGVAGLAAATTAAERGHDVTLFEASATIGGQFRMAAAIPGKEEFQETIRYFNKQIERTGVKLKLNTKVGAQELDRDFEAIVIATGVVPRSPKIIGVNHPKVLSYVDVLLGRQPVGAKVAVIGAGGIGIDVSEFLLHDPHQPIESFEKTWGIDAKVKHEGGLVSVEKNPPRREIWLLQRRPATKAMGSGPGKSSGWVSRIALKRDGVHMLGGVEYQKIDDLGLHIQHEGQLKTLAVDTIVVCAGQDSVRDLLPVDAQGKISDPRYFVIGGADFAAELDAKRAIKQGTELAARL
jgi:2,4-dienoyl-CoA reductase (NADPH2)